MSTKRVNSQKNPTNKIVKVNIDTEELGYGTNDVIMKENAREGSGGGGCCCCCCCGSGAADAEQI